MGLVSNGIEQCGIDEPEGLVSNGTDKRRN